MAITVRLTEKQEKEIEQLKKYLKFKSTSKALLHAASEHKALCDALEREKDKNRGLRWDIDALKCSIRSYDCAKNEMMELAAN